MLTSIGGLLGVLGGIIMAQVISRVSQTPVAIEYSGDHFLRGFLHGDRYRIRTAAVGKSSEPESDRCAAKRIEQKRVEKSVRVQRRCWIRADFLCGVCG